MLKILTPIPKWQWRTPSQAQHKDPHGFESCTKFKLTARLNDGFVIWQGWFDDRNDADAFLYAIQTNTLIYQRELWDLPTPIWDPYIGENLTYEFAVQNFLVTPGAGTYTYPVDFAGINTISCLGGGGGGGSADSNNPKKGGGGGGGGFSSITNFLRGTATTSAYSVGVLGSAAIGSSGASSNGGSGGATFFGATSLASSTVGANGGVGGQGNYQGALGGAGGSTTGAIGNVKYAGGAGGNGYPTTTTGLGSGGGSAGPVGVGGDGGTSSVGGSADGGTTTGPSNAAGIAGTEFDATHGCGTGAGGRTSDQNPGLQGGRYSGGGGGARAGGSPANGGPGYQGLIVIEYTPTSGFWMFF